MITVMQSDAVVKTGAACCAPYTREDIDRIKTQKNDAIQFLRQFFGTDEPTAIESYNVYAPLIIDDARVTAEAFFGFVERESVGDHLLDRELARFDGAHGDFRRVVIGGG